LGQIHANRIVGPGFVLDSCQQVLGGQIELGVVLLVVVQDGAVEVVFFNVDHADGVVAEIERLFRPRDRFVF
jgi:hypothetical protein